MALTSAATDSVISPRGRRASLGVAALRLGSIAAVAVAIIALGKRVDGASRGAIWMLAAAIIVAGVLAYGEVVAGGKAARAEERRLREAILRRQFANASNPAAPSGQFPPSHMIEMMTAGVEKATEFRQVYLGPTLAALAVPILALIYVALAIDPVVGFVTLGLMLLIPAVIGVFLLAVRTSANFSQSRRGAVTARYLDVIRNLATIRLFNAGERIGLDLRMQAEKNRATLMSMLARNQTMIMILDAMFSLVMVVAAAALVIYRADVLTLGQGLTVVLLAVVFLEPLQQVAGFFFVGIGGIRGQKDIRMYHRAIPRPHDEASPAPTAEHASDEAGGIALRGVTFDYGRGPVLTNVNLDVAHGSKVAIIGASGVGKSTLLALIQGALPLQQGSIDLGGQSRSINGVATLRGLSATVAQTTWMFTGTIADNLRIAKPDATEDEMWHALRLAHVAGEVERMPAGLDTHLGEGAALISGGQAQRISLARGLLSGRKILLLDEPTSQIDVDSEIQIVDAIAELPRNWTVLIVTHRPAVLRAVDAVYQLEAGTLTDVSQEVRTRV